MRAIPAVISDAENLRESVAPRLLTGGGVVYGVVHNELYFLPSFFEHYRALGVSLFLILDDRSNDGTSEFLAKQPDCVVLSSAYRYGDRIEGERVAHLWKNAIPLLLLQGRWAICADADEFLFIPQGFPDIAAFTAALDARGASAVIGSMVDFYPATVGELSQAASPPDRAALFSAFPYFDVGPYFRWRDEGGRPVVLDGGVRERLLRKFSIHKRRFDKKGLHLLARRLRGLFRAERNFAWVTKMPLVRWDAEKRYLNAHTLNQEPDRSLSLAIAHFKFTGFLDRKIATATASRAHAGGSRAYFAYAELLSAMRAGDGSFLCERSRRFDGPESLVRAGLLSAAFSSDSSAAWSS
jgi:hypothetical protein